jgi:hypothetical protein
VPQVRAHVIDVGNDVGRHLLDGRDRLRDIDRTRAGRERGLVDADGTRLRDAPDTPKEGTDAGRGALESPELNRREPERPDNTTMGDGCDDVPTR